MRIHAGLIVRWRRWILTAFVAFIFLGYAVMRIMLSPAALRGCVESLLARHVRGKVTIGALEGGVFRGLSVRDLVVRDGGEGALPVVQAEVIHFRPRVLGLLWGSVRLRSVDVIRPEFHVRRGSDGSWNHAGLFVMPDLDALGRPEVRVEGAVLCLEDATSTFGLAGVEIHNVNLVFRPTRRDGGEITGRLRDSRLGSVRYKIDFAVESRRGDGEIRLDDVLLSSRLRGILPASARRIWDELEVSSGLADVAAVVRYDAAAESPWLASGEVAVNNVMLRPIRFPYRISGLSCRATFRGKELTIRECQARLGGALLRAGGSVVLGDDYTANLWTHVDALDLSDDLMRAFAVKMPGVVRLWSFLRPEGKVDLTVRLKGPMREGVLPVLAAEARLREGRLSPAVLPFPVADLEGRFLVREGRLHMHDVAGTWSGARLSLPTCSLPLSPEAPFSMQAIVRELKANQSFMDAIPRTWTRQLPNWLFPYWRDLKFTGDADVRVTLYRERGKEEGLSLACEISLTGGHASHPQAPFPVENINGGLHFSDGMWRVSRLSGRMGSVDLELRDSILGPTANAPQRLTVAVRAAKPDETVEALLPGPFLQHWRRFTPVGLISLTLTTEREGSRKPGRWKTMLKVKRGAFRYQRFPYLLEQVSGHVEIDGTSLVACKLNAHGGKGSRIGIQATARGYGGGPGTALALKATGVPLDERLRAALPPRFQAIWDRFEPGGEIGFEIESRMGRAKGRPAPFSFQGKVLLAGATLARPMPVKLTSGAITFEQAEFHARDKPDKMTGRIEIPELRLGRAAFTGFFARLVVNGGDVRLTPVSAKCAGGKVSGGMVMLGGDGANRAGCQGELALQAADAAVLSREAGGALKDVAGVVSVKDTFAGGAPGLASPVLDGRMRVEKGRADGFPGAAQVLDFYREKLVGKGIPAFDAATLEYRLRGDSMHLSNIRLSGEQIALEGRASSDAGGEGDGRTLIFAAAGNGAKKDPVYGVVAEMLAGKPLPSGLTGSMDDPIWALDPLLPLVLLARDVTAALAPPVKRKGT